MILLPAMDLVGGRCVRLVQGDFARETTYDTEPRAALDAFVSAGASEAHVVDLDGAKAREPRQHALLAALAARAGPKLQVAGGFRTTAQVAAMLDAGVERVVLGSLALDDPAAFRSLFDSFGADRIVLALDIRLLDGTPMVASHGWTTDSGRSLDSVLGEFPSIRHLLVTDIGRDGMLSGPNVPLMRTIATRYPAIALQASGGVAALDDLATLRTAGAARAIVGKAIWEGRFTIAEGVARAGS